MPRGDRTGPTGNGPLTGRGMGYCKGYDVPGYMNQGLNQGFGRGRGFGRGMGRGNRWGFYATGQPGWARGHGNEMMGPFGYRNPSPPTQMNELSELGYLKDQAKTLKKMLDDVNSQISNLKNAKENEEE